MKKKDINKSLSNKTLGILGGGQLGKMIATEASRLGIKTCILDPKKNSPAFQNANYIINEKFDSKKSLKKLANYSDFITYEFENIPIESLNFLNKFSKIYPGIKALKFSQDRYEEKKFIHNLNIPVAPFYRINNVSDIKKALIKFNGRGILKTRRLGYDGKGQYLIKKFNLSDKPKNIEKDKFIIEGLIKFKKEISIIAIRSKKGKVICFQPSENKHKGGILREAKFPADINIKIKKKAIKIAEKITNSLKIVGIIAIEMFIDQNDNIIVNEVAPRPHNSGHWTMDACNISQYEALLRAIFDLPIPNIQYYNKCKMVNILGENFDIINSSMGKKNHKVYIYGKNKIKAGRKLGHINILN